uniref:Mitochondrial import inner membrane translocase subunit TIM50 n=2 Tax=Kalanchoe fedtschenkoi TaxID=63787 RepID=A0A7N0UDD9_KALFE
MAESGSKLLKQKKVLEVEDDESDNEEKGDSSELGLALEKLSLGKKKKLLVLCLGGLLFHRVFRYVRHKIPKTRSPDTTYGSFYVYKRPFVEDFLKFCFERFEVGLWSSAREWYVDNALDCLMSGLKPKLAFIWGHKKCTDTGFTTLENSKKPVYLKKLKNLWDNQTGDLPWPKGRHSAADTLMIDDEPYKSLLNPPYTAVFLRSYHADDVGDRVLEPNGALRNYLDGVVEAESVPEYVKEHPFGIPAITSDHADWYFYSNIIHKLEP